MIGNKIILYKNPITYGSFPQPYFKSESARTTFLASLESIQANKDGVNINLLENYSFILKVNVDITLCENYNFVEVIYNNKHYFADIMDYSQISLDRTKIMCKRNALYEVVDYFTYYNQFEINRCTINEPYSNNGKILLTDKPKFVYKIGNQILRSKCVAGNGTVETIKCYLLETPKYISGLPFVESGQNFSGIPFSGSFTLIPIVRGFDITYYDLNREKHSVFSHLDNFVTFSKKMEEISPYILSASIVELPFAYVDNEYILPFYASVKPFYEENNHVLYSFSISSSYSTSNVLYDLYFDLSGRYDYTNMYEEYTFYFFNNENSVTIKLSDYASNGSYNITIHMTLVPVGSSINLYVYIDNKNDKSYFSTNTERYLLNINCGISFLVSSEANFYAQNRYYQDITKATLFNKEREGQMQYDKLVNDTLLATLTGAVNVGVGNTNNAIGNFSSAGSSIIQAAYTIDKTNEDLRYYEEMRELNRKNETSKPPSQVGNSSSGFSNCLFFPICFIIEKKQTEEFTHSLQRRLDLYGIDTDITLSKMNISLFQDNGIFYIRGIAMRDQTKILNTVQDQELRRLLREGCQYKLYR